MDYRGGGDFNLITSMEDKKGGVCKMDSENLAFKEIIDQFQLIDVPSKGGWYTWSNRRGGSNHVAVVTWIYSWFWKPSFKQNNISQWNIQPFYGSNHWPISLGWENSMTPHPNLLYLKKLWLHHPEFIQNVTEWWKEKQYLYGTKMYQFHQRLKHTKNCLKKWNKEVFREHL
jgi:hypothetical protein